MPSSKDDWQRELPRKPTGSPGGCHPPRRPSRLAASPTPLVGDTPINQALPRLGPNQMTAQSFIGWMDTAGCKGRTVARSFVGLVISVLGTARL